MSILRYPVQQYAYVVNDIQVACAKWTEVFGAGPFFLMDHVKFDDTTYRGENVPVELSYAFGQAGPAHIQLIQQHDDAPSVYRDFYKKGEEGFHHWAILVPDFDAEKKRCEEFGYEPVTELVATGHVAYMDARKDLGGFIELYEDNPNVRQFFQLLEDSHKDWDGKTDAVRSAFG